MASAETPPCLTCPLAHALRPVLEPIIKELAPPLLATVPLAELPVPAPALAVALLLADTDALDADRLAELFHVRRSDMESFGKLLGRWRAEHFADVVEVLNRRKNEPLFLHPLGLVRQLILAWQAKGHPAGPA